MQDHNHDVTRWSGSSPRETARTPLRSVLTENHGPAKLPVFMVRLIFYIKYRAVLGLALALVEAGCGDSRVFGPFLGPCDIGILRKGGPLTSIFTPVSRPYF